VVVIGIFIDPATIMEKSEQLDDMNIRACSLCQNQSDMANPRPVRSTMSALPIDGKPLAQVL